MAHRNEVQARDPFDLFFIYTTGNITKQQLQTVSKMDRELAVKNLLEISFQDYKSQVVEYLEIQHKLNYGTLKTWKLISETLQNLLVGDK